MYFRHIPILFSLVFLGACSTLPSSGPTGPQVEKTIRQAATTGTGPDIALVEVNDVTAFPPADAPVEWSLPHKDPPPTDMIGPGDVLSIYIYEAGVPLFGGGTAAAELNGNGFDPSVKVQTLPPSRVDDNGDITIPYAGRLHVIGKTIVELQDQIRHSLRNLSQNPQVLVNRQEIITNSVIVGGEVARPGRLVLNTNRESIADVIALSGGYRGNAKDLVLRVERGQSEGRMRLSRVIAERGEDLLAYPGDRLTILTDPMMFSVLGASRRVQQVPFTRDAMSVVDAIAAAGGPDTNSGDPQAIFVFRFEGPNKTKPVVYHFNMMKTQTFFLAQQFALRDGDILYFGNAESNQPRKLIQTISQLFAPVVTFTNIANNVGN